MKSDTNIRVGTKIEFEIITEKGNKIGSTYISQVMDVTDSHRVSIAAPIQESRIALIPTGSRIRCYFLTYSNKLLSFIGVIIERKTKDNLQIMNLEIISGFTNVQRRDYYRLDVTVDAQYKLILEDPEENKVSPIKKALTKNISGCGACIVTFESLKGGTPLKLFLNLDATNTIELNAVVVRSINADFIALNKYFTGLNFKDINRKTQDLIIKFIFDKQQQQLKFHSND